MILESTPYPLVIKTMQEENPKYMFFVEKEMNKIQRMRYRDKFTYYSVYTHPVSKNNYMFWCGKVVTRTWFQRMGDHNMRCGACLMVNTSDGGRMVFALGKKNENGTIVDSLMVYTSHFFSRYRERCLKDSSMSTQDLIGAFYVRNSELIPLDYKKIKKNWKDFPYGAAMQVNDGLVFGDEYWYDVDGHKFYVLVNNTFVPESMLYDDQKESLFTEEKMEDIVVEYAKELIRKEEVMAGYRK